MYMITVKVFTIHTTAHKPHSSEKWLTNMGFLKADIDTLESNIADGRYSADIIVNILINNYIWIQLQFNWILNYLKT